MDRHDTRTDNRSFFGKIHWSAWCLLAFGVALLVIDHWAHVLGVLPYLVILACPLMHFFMHRGHGRKNHGGHGESPHKDAT